MKVMIYCNDLKKFADLTKGIKNKTTAYEDAILITAENNTITLIKTNQKKEQINKVVRYGEILEEGSITIPLSKINLLPSNRLVVISSKQEDYGTSFVMTANNTRHSNLTRTNLTRLDEEEFESKLTISSDDLKDCLKLSHITKEAYKKEFFTLYKDYGYSYSLNTLAYKKTNSLQMNDNNTFTVENNKFLKILEGDIFINTNEDVNEYKGENLSFYNKKEFNGELDYDTVNRYKNTQQFDFSISFRPSKLSSIKTALKKFLKDFSDNEELYSIALEIFNKKLYIYNPKNKNNKKSFDGIVSSYDNNTNSMLVVVNGKQFLNIINQFKECAFYFTGSKKAVTVSNSVLIFDDYFEAILPIDFKEEVVEVVEAN